MKNISQKTKIQKLTGNNSGFIVAEFLFSFAMVLGIGILIFTITFSLATIEIAQYIVWSTARNYAAGNTDELTANKQAKEKFRNLTSRFPLLTGNGADSPWFELNDTNLVIGDLTTGDAEFNISTEDKRNDFRQPWIGAKAKIKLKLFSSLQVPFLGKAVEDETLFEFPVRAFIIRSPSTTECRNFFYRDRFIEGIKKLENGALSPTSTSVLPSGGVANGWGEDNGC